MNGDQYFIIFHRSTPKVVEKGLCFLHVQLVNEIIFHRLHCSMHANFRLSHCTLGTVPVNLFVSFKAKRSVGSFELLFAFLACTKVKLGERKKKTLKCISFILFLVESCRYVNKSVYFWKQEILWGVYMHGFYMTIWGSPLFFQSILQFNSTIHQGKHCVLNSSWTQELPMVYLHCYKLFSLYLLRKNSF